MPQSLPKEIAEILRVNQAGEYGARRIYRGQLDVIKDPKEHAIISHMAEQEEEHLAEFNRLVIEHNVQPTILHPLWHVGGYAMGAISALISKEAAHACTIAVEEVIDEHYQQQLDFLKTSPHSAPDLINKIQKFKDDEQEHRQTAIDQGGESAPFYPILHAVVKGITRFAIAASKKI